MLIEVVVFSLFYRFEYRRILKHFAPCVGLGYVQEIGDCVGKDDPPKSAFFRLSLRDIE